MRWLNYHHLLYFWTVARTGSIAAASRELFLSPPAISTQIKSLELMFGTPLFARSGRGLELTPAGHKAYAYADRIFRLGTELRDALELEGTRTRLRVGLSQMTPKLLASRWLTPLFGGGVVVECTEGRVDTLATLLAERNLDLVLSDEELGGDGADRPEAEHLARIDYALYARPGLVDMREAFPRLLHGAPVLLPASRTALRARLASWFDRHGVVPELVAEGDDGALLVELARSGVGVVAAPVEMKEDLGVVFGLEQLGVATGVHANVILTTTHALRRHQGIERLLELRAPAPLADLPATTVP